MKKHLFVSAALALGVGLVYGLPGKSQAQQVSRPKTAGTFITFDAPVPAQVSIKVLTWRA